MEWPYKQIMLVLICASLTQAGTFLTASQSLGNTKAPDFSLRDQYDRPYTLQAFAGRLLVLLASDKKGDEQTHRWGAQIRKKYGYRVQLTGVADVRKAPFFLKGKIRSDFKKVREVILLDWDGVVFNSYGLNGGVANVILIDGRGMVRYQYAGSPSPQAVEGLFRAMDEWNSASNVIPENPDR